MPNVFKSVTVYPNYNLGHRIEWSLEPTFNDVQPFNFSVEISESEEFTEVLFSIPVGDTYFAVDNTHTKQNLTANYVYRVTLTTGSGATYHSNTISLGNIDGGPMKFQQGAEIMRLELVSHRFSGQFGYFMKRKTYGNLAIADIDPVSGAVIADNSDNYGTNIDGGYYAPIPISFRILSLAQKRKQAEDGMGTQEIYTLNIRTIGYPRISDEDIIIRARDDTRYNVKNVQTTFIPGIGLPVIQTCDLMLIPVTDTIYQIAMPNGS